MRVLERLTPIIWSVFCLLNVMLLPVFEPLGGFIPDRRSNSFFEVLEAALESSDNWSFWVVQFTMSIFIPAVLMLIFAIVGSRIAFAVCNGCGIIFLLKQLYDYGSRYDWADGVFFGEYTGISVGTWVALLLFILSAVFAVSAIAGPRADDEDDYVVLDEPSQPNGAARCPKCHGFKQPDSSYCDNCGYRF